MTVLVDLPGRLQWYLGRTDVGRDAERVIVGVPLALIGGPWDDLEGFADRIAPERPVVDLADRTPSARELRELYRAHPDTIVLAHRPERVVGVLGTIAQPWYMPISPLTARPDQAVGLLREAIANLGVRRSIDDLGHHVVEGLEAYAWPRGLREIREASRRLGAVLESGSIRAAASRLAVSRQAVSKYLCRRLA